MARQIRIEYPGAVYHITSRGNARKKIFLSNKDYLLFLGILKDTIDRYNWISYSYCLMPNHYHLFIETVDPNLSQGMRQLNGVFTQKYNYYNKKTGHIFQGRYKAALVEKESYFGQVMRYIAMNPVKAKLVSRPEQWKWSGHNEIVSLKNKIIDHEKALRHFDDNKKKAVLVYKSLFKKEIDNEFNIKDELKGGFILGTEGFIDNIKALFCGKEAINEIPKKERYISRPSLGKLFKNKAIDKSERNKLICLANLKHGYSLTEISNHLNCHYSTLSKIIKQDRGRNSQFKT
jgi:putative transposase